MITQAQIEAAAEAMHRYDVGHGLNLDGLASAENYLPIAQAALTAAAEVGLPTADDVKGILKPDWLHPATIERCAQELEKAYAECDTLNLLHGAARIRALKEK